MRAAPWNSGPSFFPIPSTTRPPVGGDAEKPRKRGENGGLAEENEKKRRSTQKNHGPSNKKIGEHL